MGCPVHIWVPLIGAAAPFARIARHRLRAAFARPAPADDTAREVKRWAPVGQTPDASERTS